MDQYQVIAIGIAFLGVIIGIILYQISKIFNLGGLKRISEIFIWEAGVTILLALFIFLIVDRMNSFLFDVSEMMYKSIGRDISQITPKTPMAAAKAVLKELINSCYLSTYGILVLNRIVLESLGSSISDLGAEVGRLPTATVAYALIYISDLLRIMFFLLWTSIAMLKIFLFFSAYYPFLIMLGIILRAFEPTKSMGAYLISLGIGLYIVLPTAYTVGLVLNYNDLLCKLPESFRGDQTLQMGVANAIDIGENAKSFMGFSSMLVMLSSGFIILLNPNLMVSLIYSVMSLALITPLIAFIIALSFVNISTTALGGRISEVGRGLFRLV
ncbi:MAG: hypothetical protein NZ908_00365 [Candidatus Micrarchaeota archaeon]|nr:hypothetical protein [Candidatus Micrarchaeota archaeon]MCX8154634.1 hypothetical protein [Candidatus Micrarchaeota archaeon]